ncbi:uncharacterized protein J3R85_001640 [Psidium guajava]|nr:uncharacterized protein J3R85_001640 [Psidium guajava]
MSCNSRDSWDKVPVVTSNGADHKAVGSLPASAGKVDNSFNYPGTKSHGTTSVLSCFKCGQGHGAGNYTSASSGTGNSSAPGSCYRCGKAGRLPKDCLPQDIMAKWERQ